MSTQAQEYTHQNLDEITYLIEFSRINKKYPLNVRLTFEIPEHLEEFKKFVKIKKQSKPREINLLDSDPEDHNPEPLELVKEASEPLLTNEYNVVQQNTSNSSNSIAGRNIELQSTQPDQNGQYNNIYLNEVSNIQESSEQNQLEQVCIEEHTNQADQSLVLRQQDRGLVPDQMDINESFKFKNIRQVQPYRKNFSLKSKLAELIMTKIHTKKISEIIRQHEIRIYPQIDSQWTIEGKEEKIVIEVVKKLQEISGYSLPQQFIIDMYQDCKIDFKTDSNSAQAFKQSNYIKELLAKKEIEMLYYDKSIYLITKRQGDFLSFCLDLIKLFLRFYKGVCYEFLSTKSISKQQQQTLYQKMFTAMKYEFFLRFIQPELKKILNNLKDFVNIQVFEKYCVVDIDIGPLKPDQKENKFLNNKICSLIHSQLKHQVLAYLQFDRLPLGGNTQQYDSQNLFNSMKSYIQERKIVIFYDTSQEYSVISILGDPTDILGYLNQLIAQDRKAPYWKNRNIPFRLIIRNSNIFANLSTIFYQKNSHLDFSQKQNLQQIEDDLIQKKRDLTRNLKDYIPIDLLTNNNEYISIEKKEEICFRNYCNKFQLINIQVKVLELFVQVRITLNESFNTNRLQLIQEVQSLLHNLNLQTSGWCTKLLSNENRKDEQQSYNQIFTQTLQAPQRQQILSNRSERNIQQEDESENNQDFSIFCLNNDQSPWQNDISIDNSNILQQQQQNHEQSRHFSDPILQQI